MKAPLNLMMLCFLFCACSKKQTEVEMEPPQAVKELIIDMEANPSVCTCHPYINQYIWRNENVYVLANNDSLNIGYVCDWIPVFYHSDGQEFKLKAGYTYEKFLKESRLVKAVWVCEQKP